MQACSRVLNVDQSITILIARDVSQARQHRQELGLGSSGDLFRTGRREFRGKQCLWLDQWCFATLFRGSADGEMRLKKQCIVGRALLGSGRGDSTSAQTPRVFPVSSLPPLLPNPEVSHRPAAADGVVVVGKDYALCSNPTEKAATEP